MTKTMITLPGGTPAGCCLIEEGTFTRAAMVRKFRAWADGEAARVRFIAAIHAAADDDFYVAVTKVAHGVPFSETRKELKP